MKRDSLIIVRGGGAKSLKPSKRGELEITDINKIYLENGDLDIRLMGRGLSKSILS